MAPLPRPADSLECAVVSELHAELSAIGEDAARARMGGRPHQCVPLGAALWPGASETLPRLSQIFVEESPPQTRWLMPHANHRYLLRRGSWAFQPLPADTTLDKYGILY